MRVNPSRETALAFGPMAAGALAGLAFRSLTSPFSLTEKDSLCKQGCSHPFLSHEYSLSNRLLNLVNDLGQTEIKWLATASLVLIPLSAKIAYDAYRSKQQKIMAKIIEATQTNLTAGEAAALCAISALGLSKQTVPLLKAACQPFASEGFKASGHFFTKIITSALGASVMKTIDDNSSPAEKKAASLYYGATAIKDAMLAFVTVGLCYHSVPEVVVGSAFGLAAVAGANASKKLL